MKDYVMELEHIENSLVDRVDGKKLMDYTSNIAKWVRISGTQEEVDSLLYCEKVMKEIGYETKLTFHDAFISVPVRAHVEMVSPVPMGFRALTHCFTRSAPEHGLEGVAADSDSPDINGLIALKGRFKKPSFSCIARFSGVQPLKLILYPSHDIG